MLKRLLIAIYFLLATVLFGCDEKPVFHNLDVTGIAGYANDFRMTDHNGTPRTMADFRGKVVVLFFGFTHCPDVCPTTLSDMRKVMERLGDDAKRVQVLFVTVDPARDTPTLLSKYVPAFHPSFLGLHGDSAATQKMASDFKILYKLREGQTPETYTVDHTAASLVFDAAGRLRLFVGYGMEPDKILADIQLLLKGKL